MSKELRIGILGLLSIFVVIFGLKFLKGKDVFSKTSYYYAIYDNVDNLKLSNAVLINGFQVGAVTAIKINPANMQSLIVEFNVDPKIKLPKSTVAEIYSAGFLGDKMIRLAYSGVCTGDCAVSGDTLAGTTKGLLSSLLSVDDVNGYMSAFQQGLGSILDTLDQHLQDPNNKNGLNKSLKDIQAIIANLKTSSDHLNNMFAHSEGKIDRILTNAEGVTGNLNKKSVQIASIVDNVNAITGQLNKADLGKTVNKANTTFDEASQAIASLNKTLDKAEQSMNDLSKILQGIEKGQGSLGKLAKDDNLYKNLDKTLKDANLLLQDIRLNPKRYINVSVFGKKKIPEYTSPEEDPAYKEK